MGSFSFMYADGGKNNQANMLPGDKVRILVPMLMGGGSLNGVYDDYGVVSFSDGTSVDLYELVALWNSTAVRAAAAKVTGVPALDAACKMADDEFTPFARNVGIRVACYDEDMVRLQHPLRVVSADNTSVSYETVGGISVADQNQGFDAYPWGDYGLGESMAVYLDGLRAQNRAAGRWPLGDISLSDDERERVEEILRAS
jgi:hypothetical protein